MKKYVNFAGMTWPSPITARELAGKLRNKRYPAISRQDTLYVASVLSAYAALCDKPAKNVGSIMVAIRRAVKKHKTAYDDVAAP